jgi:hypothetical protein
MTPIGSQTIRKVLDVLQSAQSLARVIANISAESGANLPAISPEQIRAMNASPEVTERSTATSYPSINVYCERISNTLREKFRRFSGSARMAVEVRGSLDRLEGLEEQVRFYADAVAQVLDNNRGDWGDGVFYPGGYEVTFGPVKQGGRNYLQTAKASFEVEISY